jgi:hypothetical protein
MEGNCGKERTRRPYGERPHKGEDLRRRHREKLSMSSSDDSWLLGFDYTHSAHQVTAYLDISIVPEFQGIIMLPAIGDDCSASSRQPVKKETCVSTGWS